MAKIIFDVQGGGLRRDIRKMGRAAADAHPFLRSVARRLMTRIRLGFKSGRGPDGTPWETPLKFRTGSRNRDTGALQASIAPSFGSDFVDIGTNKRQARLLHFGGIVRPVRAKVLAFKDQISGEMIFAKSVKIPASPFLPISPSGQADFPPAWEKSVHDAFNEHIFGKDKR